MAFFRLGFLTTLLSDPVIQGFTTGAAFHVMTSQVKYLFGLDKAIGKYTGPLALFKVGMLRVLSLIYITATTKLLLLL